MPNFSHCLHLSGSLRLPVYLDIEQTPRPKSPGGRYGGAHFNQYRSYVTNLIFINLLMKKIMERERKAACALLLGISSSPPSIRSSLRLDKTCTISHLVGGAATFKLFSGSFTQPPVSERGREKETPAPPPVKPPAAERGNKRVVPVFLAHAEQ